VLTKIEEGKFFVKSSKSGDLVFTNEWNAIQLPSPFGRDPVLVTPHNRYFSFPLWEGKKWSGGINIRRTPSLVRREVKRWESVKVPAGTFAAIRVEGGTTEAGNVPCWYAPEVQYPIKCEGAGNSWYAWELLEFELK
jgi:hypothetical protein